MRFKIFLPFLFLSLAFTVLDSAESLGKQERCPEGFASLAQQKLFKTKRLEMAPVQAMDYNDALAIYMDPQVQQMSGDTYGSDFFRRLLTLGIKKVPTPEEFMLSSVYMGVRRRGKDELLGVVSLKASAYPMYHTKNAALLKMAGIFASTGYHFKPSTWGKGIATEASSALNSYAFDQLKLDGIFATVRPKNVGSMAVLEKQGFVKVARPGEIDELAHFFLSKKKYYELKKRGSAR